MSENLGVRASFGDDQKPILLIDRSHEFISSSPALFLNIGEMPIHGQTSGQRVLRNKPKNRISTQVFHTLPSVKTDVFRIVHYPFQSNFVVQATPEKLPEGFMIFIVCGYGIDINYSERFCQLLKAELIGIQIVNSLLLLEFAPSIVLGVTEQVHSFYYLIERFR